MQVKALFTYLYIPRKLAKLYDLQPKTMAGTSTNDLTEEDAADLQFPKEHKPYFSRDIPETECCNCCTELPDTYILCAECMINICCPCFAQGVEFFGHKNDHCYSVMHSDFILFEHSDWTAKEELALVSGLQQFGNFEIVAKRLNKNLSEVVEHYDYFYLQRRGCADFPITPETRASVFPEPVIPYRFKVFNVRDPHRPSESYHTAGYSAARSDFEVNYDKGNEAALSMLESSRSGDDNACLVNDVMCDVVRSYNQRCKERTRRHSIIREHGYDTTITPPVYERLTRFMQFFKAEEFEMFMEGLHRVGELKMQIARLCELRRKGVRTLKGAQLYLNLAQRQEKDFRILRSFRADPALEIKPIFLAAPIIEPYKRRGFTPLDILGLPSYDRLLPSERDLCTNARIVPVAYLELKELLIKENNKLGFLKLCTARKMLKIDVNKTRKLYDFLIQEGFINKPKK